MTPILDVSKFGSCQAIQGFSYRVFTSGKVVNYRGETPIREIGCLNQAGYVRVTMTARNLDATVTYGREFVHRLVAQAFIPNPEGLPEVDHVDGDKLNNAVSNLRWVSRAENMEAAFKRKGNWLAKYSGQTGQRVRSITPAGITYFNSALEAAKLMGNPRRAANICKAIQTGRIAYGAYWSKASTPEEVAKASVKENTLPTSV
jgi:hypothetical protein